MQSRVKRRAVIAAIAVTALTGGGAGAWAAAQGERGTDTVTTVSDQTTDEPAASTTPSPDVSATPSPADTATTATVEQSRPPVQAPVPLPKAPKVQQEAPVPADEPTQPEPQDGPPGATNRPPPVPTIPGGIWPRGPETAEPTSD